MSHFRHLKLSVIFLQVNEFFSFVKSYEKVEQYALHVKPPSVLTNVLYDAHFNKPSTVLAFVKRLAYSSSVSKSMVSNFCSPDVFESGSSLILFVFNVLIWSPRSVIEKYFSFLGSFFAKR